MDYLGKKNSLGLPVMNTDYLRINGTGAVGEWVNLVITGPTSFSQKVQVGATGKFSVLLNQPIPLINSQQFYTLTAQGLSTNSSPNSPSTPNLNFCVMTSIPDYSTLKINDNTTPGIYIIQNGERHLLAYKDWVSMGSPVGYLLPATAVNAIPFGAPYIPDGTPVTDSAYPNHYYIIEDGEADPITNAAWQAINTDVNVPGLPPIDAGPTYPLETLAYPLNSITATQLGLIPIGPPLTPLTYARAQATLTQGAPGSFRDSYGYVLPNTSSTGGGTFQRQGDAVMLTAISAVATALSGDNADTLRSLTAIYNGSFLPNGEPVNHPLDQSPMSKDSLSPVIAACYFAAIPNGNPQDAAVVTMARNLIQKYVDWLIPHSWTLGPYPSYSRPGNPPRGPDSYALTPSLFFALRDTAQKLGISTAVGWNAWQFVTPLVASEWPGVLTSIENFVHQNTTSSITVTPTSNASLALTDEVLPNLGRSLSDSLKSLGKDLSSVENAVDKTFIVTLLAQLASTTPALAAVNFASAEANAVLSQLPATIVDIFGKNKLTTLLEKAANAALYPLTKGLAALAQLTDEAIQVVTMSSENALLALTLPNNYYNLNLEFWPTLVVAEAQPIPAEAIAPSIASLNSTVQSQNMALYYWLTGDSARVSQELGYFENDPQYAQENYMWEHEQTGNQDKDDQTVRQQMLPPDVANSNDGWYPRIDFMVLYQLSQMSKNGLIRLA